MMSRATGFNKDGVSELFNLLETNVERKYEVHNQQMHSILNLIKFKNLH